MNLYLKYRPQTFNDVVGQNHITETIYRSILSKNYPHAFLLSGQRGTGKTTIGRLIAKALNCEDPICNKCNVCEAVASSNFPDLIEIDAASNRGIDNIRSLIERVHYSPINKVKVYIIDECHMLTREASNALLKILEEPPQNVVFVLATTEEEKLLPTIKSRCQIHRFKLIDDEVITNQLEKICTLEMIDLDTEIVEFLAKQAKGSMRDAISLLDLARNIGNDLNAIKTAIGESSYEQLSAFIGYLGEKDIYNLFTILKQIESSGANLEQFLTSVEEYLQHINYALIGIKTYHPMQEIIEKQKSLFSRGDIIVCLDALSKWRLRYMPFNLLVFEAAVSEICLAEPVKEVIENKKEKYTVSEDTLSALLNSKHSSPIEENEDGFDF